MLHLYLGTDRKKTRDAMNAAVKKIGKRERVQVSDANTLADLDTALSGGGMFGGPRTVVLDGIFANEEMRERFIERIESVKASEDAVFLFEEKLDAATKRAVSKHVERTETFDKPKGERDNAIFGLRFALEKGDKKTLWVGLMKEYAAGKAPEAVHGFLFWAAKQVVLSARTDAGKIRGKKLLARVAELPHESRRKGVELEYALERFALSEV